MGGAHVSYQGGKGGSLNVGGGGEYLRGSGHHGGHHGENKQR